MSVAPSQNQPASERQRRKAPGFNVYTAMLILSFLALCTGCLVMYMHLNGEYGNYPWWNTSEAGGGASGTSMNVTPRPSLFADVVEFDHPIEHL